MSKMYKDAVIEANKLRELAEQNAKNKIIEAVAPRIRKLIEQELLDDEELALDDEFDDEPLPAGVNDYEMPDVEPGLAPEDDAVLAATMAPDEMGLPADDLVGDDLFDDDLAGFEASAPTEFSFEKDGKQVKVSVTVEGSKSDRVLNVSPDVLKRFGGSRYKLKENSLGFLITHLNEAKTAKKKRAVLKEIRKIRKRLIVMTEAGDASSRKKLKALDFLLKESMKMSRKGNRRSRRLTERAWWLMEQDDLEGGDGDELGLDDELDLEDEEGDDEMVPKSDVVDAVAAVLDVDPTELQDLVAGSEGEEGEEGEEDFELEDEDLEEWGLREQDEDEDEEEEEDEDDKKKKTDEVVEISEAMLRREIARMSRSRKVAASRRRPSRRVSESARRRRAALRRRHRLQEQGPMDGSGASSYGGGTKDKEPFIEVDEDTLLNALAEELGEMTDGGGDANKGQSAFGDASPAGAVDLDGTNLATESRRRAARRRAASRRPTGRRMQVAEAAARKNARRAQLAERKVKAARKELKESNLFNAKLLYVNKLMQSYDLNTKQQRAIVEALDNAKTLREAKLLYTSLTESLRKRRTSGSGRISEGLLRTGSASKSTRSAAPAKNGMELDRWAVLAGIAKPE